MSEAIKGLLGSKKFITTITVAVAALAARLGLPEGAAEQVAGGIVALGLALLGGQAATDHGKEAKRIEVEGTTP